MKNHLLLRFPSWTNFSLEKYPLLIRNLSWNTLNENNRRYNFHCCCFQLLAIFELVGWLVITFLKVFLISSLFAWWTDAELSQLLILLFLMFIVMALSWQDILAQGRLQIFICLSRLNLLFLKFIVMFLSLQVILVYAFEQISIR